MDKIKRRAVSLKWSFVLYLPICVIISFAGSMGIGFATNELQDLYTNNYSDPNAEGVSGYEFFFNKDGEVKYEYYERGKITDNTHRIIYFIISNTQVILIPLWIFGCIAVTGMIFYNRELKRPINILLDAAKKISANELDFEVAYYKQNELGKLCTAFDEMRCALDENNRDMWRSLEERKRLNTAFSHDLRTPLTVLRGYTEYLEKYAPDGKVSDEKLMSVLSMMDSQIGRLESYTYKMSALQKLEDLMPDIKQIDTEKLKQNLFESGKLICDKKQFEFNFNVDAETINIDIELCLQVYENLISNAVRYAENMISVECIVFENMFQITVSDDGKGFSEQGLKLAQNAFYRDEKEQNGTHFGLGLYISKIICEKCGGALKLSNKNGGNVSAEFLIM